MGRRISRIAWWCACAPMTLTLTACASQTAEVHDTEQMLAAAGFHATPAMTPQDQKQLAALPPLLLLLMMMMQPRRIGSTTEA